jgi:hypothetical protein
VSYAAVEPRRLTTTATTTMRASSPMTNHHMSVSLRSPGPGMQVEFPPKQRWCPHSRPCLDLSVSAHHASPTVLGPAPPVTSPRQSSSHIVPDGASFSSSKAAPRSWGADSCPQLAKTGDQHPQSGWVDLRLLAANESRTRRLRRRRRGVREDADCYAGVGTSADGGGTIDPLAGGSYQRAAC